MNAETFVDTNVLVYAFDVDAGSKQDIAIQTLAGLWESKTGHVSPQVLQEFYNSLTRKLTTRVSKQTARRAVDLYSSWCVEVGPADIAAAFRIEDEARINFWDALIVSCAHKAGATRLLSEDLNAGQRIAGIEVENPFARAHP